VGVENTFKKILMFFSAANLGLIPAISYSLYKPLAANDIEKVKATVKFIRNLCWTLATLFMLIGIPFTFCLQLVVNKADNIYAIPGIRLIYLLSLVNIVLPWFFAHRQSVILYDQKKYIVVLINFIAVSIRIIAQIIFLDKRPSLVSFVVCMVFSTLLEGLMVFSVSKWQYPFLSEKGGSSLSRKEVTASLKNAWGGSLSQVFGLIVNVTNGVYISRFAGLSAAGIQSSYDAILEVIKTFNWNFCEAIGPSVGNLAALGEHKKLEKRFFSLLLLSNWIFGSAVCVLVPNFAPLVRVWRPSLTVFDNFTSAVIFANFYVFAIRKLILMFKGNMGIYWAGKYVTFWEAVLNLILGYLLRGYGVAGISAALTISILCTCFWWDPLLLFRLGFKTSSVPFFKKQLVYYLMTGISCIISVFMCVRLDLLGWPRVLIGGIISIFAQTSVFWVMFRTTEEFLFLKGLARRVFVSRV
jgi:hypothetical protein